MNKLLLTLLLLWSCLAGRSQVLTLPLSEPATPGLWLCFRTRLHLDKEPSEAELRIAADSKYWLWTNGTLQVREGGLKRGPNPQDTYCDVLHGTRGLHRGDNTVAVLVWYFGKDGFSHRNSPTPGLAFSLKVDGKPTDTDGPWRVCRHPAYYLPQGEAPNYRLPESNIGFDASRDIPFQLPDYDDHAWSGGPLTILSQYIAGIETVEPAFSVFSVCPHPGNLSRVKATVPLSEGRSIGADIRKDPGQCSLLLTVPRRTQAVLLLPQGYSRLEVDGKPAEPGTRLKAGSWQVVYR